MLFRNLERLTGCLRLTNRTYSCLPARVAFPRIQFIRLSRPFSECAEDKDKHIKDAAEATGWRPVVLSPVNTLRYYVRLSKFRLTALVAMTTIAGYGLAPGPCDPATVGIIALATLIGSSSANAINQFLEVPFDSQMKRTRNRVLVLGLMSTTQACCYGVATSFIAPLILHFFVNDLSASLALLNFILYTCIYTPCKRLTILNTWIGSVVGALPPMIGWIAKTGSLDMGALALGAILFCWQFPHFNSLCWNYRPDYSRAGYRMMAVTNPDMCRRVALRHSVAQLGLATLLYLSGSVTWWFCLTSFPINGALVHLAYKFHQQSDSQTARRLFFYSLIHLPIILALAFLHRKSDDGVTAIPSGQLLENRIPPEDPHTG